MKSYRLERNGSLAGKILRVDLSSNRVWTEDTYAYARRFLVLSLNTCMVTS
jgi:hypothetical protein